LQTTSNLIGLQSWLAGPTCNSRSEVINRHFCADRHDWCQLLLPLLVQHSSLPMCPRTSRLLGLRCSLPSAVRSINQCLDARSLSFPHSFSHRSAAPSRVVPPTLSTGSMQRSITLPDRLLSDLTSWLLATSVDMLTRLTHCWSHGSRPSCSFGYPLESAPGGGLPARVVERSIQTSMSFGFKSSTLTPSSVADYWYGRVPGKMSVATSITAKEQRDTQPGNWCRGSLVDA